MLLCVAQNGIGPLVPCWQRWSRRATKISRGYCTIVVAHPWATLPCVRSAAGSWSFRPSNRAGTKMTYWRKMSPRCDILLSHISRGTIAAPTVYSSLGIVKSSSTSVLSEISMACHYIANLTVHTSDTKNLIILANVTTENKSKIIWGIYNHWIEEV